MKKVFILPLILIATINISFSNNLGQRKVYEVLESKTKIKNPFQLRDPFKVPKVLKVGRVKKKEEREIAIKDGVGSDEQSIEGVPLENIKIVGILMGHNRRAIARIKGRTKKSSKRGKRSSKRGKSKGTFILREGMKLGENKAELKAILPGGIVLVEKIKNIYDQEEYFETIIPLSNE